MFRFSRPLWQKARPTREQLDQLRSIRDRMLRERRRKDVTTIVLYGLSGMIAFGTLSYASVPLYRALCSRTGFGGTPLTDSSKFAPERMEAVARDKRISVKFSSEVSSQLPWSFRPEQREVSVLPGETALAFYKAKNNSNEPLIGMATYTVVPDRAAAYFSKIQCFCFEEQMLMPGEEVDMPLFFFLDPDYARDPAMQHMDDIILHYTFFKAQYEGEGEDRRVAAELATKFQPSPSSSSGTVPAVTQSQAPVQIKPEPQLQAQAQQVQAQQ